VTTVYLIRHADVENPRRVLYGHLEGFGLSELGRRQAVEVGRRLSTDPPRLILHSPLQRARETAEIIAENLGVPVEVRVDPELTEAEFSRYLQGVPYWQVPSRRPLWFIHKLKRGLLKRDESIAAMGGRIVAVMHRLGREHPGATTAIVSHADPLQAAWILLDGRPQREREMYRKQVARAGMLKVTLDGDSVTTVEYIAAARPALIDREAAAGAA
jgi:broad specificity phosphatase PhoE